MLLLISDTGELVEKSHRISLIFVDNLVVTLPPTALHVDVIFQIIDPPGSDSRKVRYCFCKFCGFVVIDCVLFQLAHRARRLPDKADHSSRGRHRQVTTSVASLGLPRSIVSYSTSSTVIVSMVGEPKSQLCRHLIFLSYYGVFANTGESVCGCVVNEQDADVQEPRADDPTRPLLGRGRQPFTEHGQQRLRTGACSKQPIFFPPNVAAIVKKKKTIDQGENAVLLE